MPGTPPESRAPRTLHGEKRTIVDAIREVLGASPAPLTAVEVHAAIEARGLYAFNSPQAAHVVRTQLRRHTEGATGDAAHAKYFRSLPDGRYALLAQASE